MTPEPTASTRVEAYLDQLLVPLARNLSDFHRDELRRELRAHLWGRVDAYRELDYSKDDAVTEALRQFGGANDFARQWRQEWIAGERCSACNEIFMASISGLRLSLPALAATWLGVYLLWLIVINTLPSSYIGGLLTVYDHVLLWLSGTIFFGTSLWTGSLQGRRVPKRSGWGMFAALSTVIVAGSAASLLGTRFGLEGTMCGGFYTSMPLMAAAWLPTACLAAAVSGWHTQRKRVLA